MYAKQVDFGINLTFHQIAFVPNVRLVIFFKTLETKENSLKICGKM